jgi:hypothetical protein
MPPNGPFVKELSTMHLRDSNDALDPSYGGRKSYMRLYKSEIEGDDDNGMV